MQPSPNLTEARRLLNAGLKLVKLHPYTKQPIGIEWNKHSATSIDDDATGYGIPLTVNGLSSIDPDHMEMARVTMKAWGFDLDELLNAGVRTSSTRPDSGGRSAFLADPEGKARWLPFRVFDGQGRSLTLLELRAASMNLQDVVPGIVYANKDSGELYSQQYANEHRFDAAPTVPERFLALWRELSTNDDKLREYSRIAIDAIRDAGFKVNGDAPQYRPPMGGGVQLAFPAKGIRTEFNKAHTVDTILTRHGYTYHERKGRWAHPGATGAPAIRPIPGKEGLWQSDHGGDPLHGTFDAWAAHVQLDHAGDVDAARAEWMWQGINTDGEVSFLDAPKKKTPTSVTDGLQQLMDRLRLSEPEEARSVVVDLLRLAEELPQLEQIEWHKQVRDVMHWNTPDFKGVLKELRSEWYAKIRERAAQSGIQPMPKENYPDVIFNDTTGSLKVVSTIPNLKAMIDHYGIQVSYDVITKKTQVIVPGMTGSPDNQDNSALTRVISLGKLNELNSDMIPAYVEAIADERQINPVADWIVSSPWDGIDRLPLIYETLILQANYPKELRNTLVRRWLISAVAAAFKPCGFKSRGVLTLTGPQSLGKTSWLQSLVPDVRLMERVVKVDHLLDPSNKDSVLSAVSHWLVELGELDSTFRKADIGKIKGFITAGMDKLRRPYARLDSEYQRRTVFFASVNDDKFLVDETGNTRFWTVAVKAVNYQHGLDMQQIWAQVARLYNEGEQWWLTREEETLLEESNNQHRVVSSIHELIEGELLWDSNLEHWTRLSASAVLKRIGFDKPTNPQAKDAGRALRELGCEERNAKGLTKFLVPPNKTITRVF